MNHRGPYIMGLTFFKYEIKQVEPYAFRASAHWVKKQTQAEAASFRAVSQPNVTNVRSVATASELARASLRSFATFIYVIPPPAETTVITNLIITLLIINEST